MDLLLDSMLRPVCQGRERSRTFLLQELMFTISFDGKSQGEVPLEQELNLLGAAAKGGLALNHRCGGHARCGTCLVTIESGADQLSPVGASEARILRILKARENQRLACQAWAHGDVACRIE